MLDTESALVRVAEALLRGAARGAGGESPLRAIRQEIERGADPLGDAFCRLRSPGVRRTSGAVYSPSAIVEAMSQWAVSHAAKRGVTRVVDPGAGSGRFLRAAGERFASAELVAVELDPVAVAVLRANLHVAGLGDRLRIIQGDYRSATLGVTGGRTLFIGNPPYVRHHGIEPKWKRWLSEQAKMLGHGASQLAGLHVHFFLATALHGRAGDFGAFVTSAEWLDVNYGRFLRELLLGPLGGLAVHSLDAVAEPFAGAMTTAAITTFELGTRPAALKFRHVARLAELAPLDGGRTVSREHVASATRWTSLFRAPLRRPSGTVELGELFRVHRGQVTGRNAVWIAGPHSAGLPTSVAYPTVTRAKELFASGTALTDASALRSVIDLPEDLDELSESERRAVERFLRVARIMGAHEGFIARHRRAWWSVGLAAPAPILATYMARRSPAFVRNVVRARHINIAHGLYPREPIPQNLLDAYARCLSTGTSRADGRTYAGGLTKFEPKEMERLLVPSPDRLEH
jgi:adenine-specific DNA-methyltransferase